MRPALLGVVLCLAVGCQPELGECDQAAAIRVAYNQFDGTPAYEGQALAISSCGNGAFCHGANPDPDNATGAPSGLSFDVRLAAVDGRTAEREVARLRRGRFRVVQEGRLILHTVDLGTMPPPASSPRVQEYYMGAPTYVRAEVGDFIELPSFLAEDAAERDEAREILRNWLACAAPVVERPVPRDDGVPAVVVPPLDLAPIEPTWDSIFNDLLRGRGCAGARCHGGTESGFRVTSMEETYDALVGAMASSEECGGSGMLVTGDPGTSLLLEKLRSSPSCGERMPLSGLPLNSDDIAAVEQWIADGAPES